MRLILTLLLALGWAVAVEPHSTQGVVEAIAYDSRGAVTDCPDWAAPTEGFGEPRCIHFMTDTDAARVRIEYAFDEGQYPLWLGPWFFIPPQVMYRNFLTPGTGHQWSIIMTEYEPLMTIVIIAEFLDMP